MSVPSSEDKPANASSSTLSITSSPPKLIQILSSLTPNMNRQQLYEQFHSILIHGHLYHGQWGQLPPTLLSQIFDLIINFIRKYEANGLQLHGCGVMILERILYEGKISLINSSSSSSASSSSSSSSKNNSVDVILEVLLRILLEHPIYLICIQILWNEIKKEPSIFPRLCLVAIRIVDELPHPLLIENFIAFSNFFFELLRINWNHQNCHLAFHSLMVIAPIVETSNVRFHFHFEKFLKLCQQFLNESQSKEAEAKAEANGESLLLFDGMKPPLVTLFTLLTELCPLHPHCISYFLSFGFIQTAIDFLLTIITIPSTILDQQLLSSLFQFLTTACWSDEVILLIVNQITRLNLQEILNYCWFENSLQSQPRRQSFDGENPVLQIRNDISSVSSFVNFCSATYGSPFISLKSVDNLILLIETYFHYSIETLKLHSLTFAETPQWTDHIISILTGMRHFGSGRLAHLLIHPTSSSSSASSSSSSQLLEYKYQVVNLIKYYLPTFDDSNTSTDLPLLYILAIDVYSLLNGSIDKCWKKIRTTDEELESLMSSVHLSMEMQRKHSRALLSSIVLCQPSTITEELKKESLAPSQAQSQSQSQSQLQLQQPHERNRNSPSSFEHTPISLNDSENKYPLLPFFLAEMNGGSIGQNLPDILQHFLNEWENNSNLEVYQKILIILGILRSSAVVDITATPLLPQFAEVLVELLTDDRHGIQEYNGMQEKCLQLLIDITCLDNSCLTIAIQTIELVFDILTSVHVALNPFLIYTCISYLLTVSQVLKCGKLIIQSISKLENIIRRCGSISLLVAILNLYSRVNHLFSRFTTDDEKILVRWIVKCVTSKIEILKEYGCQYICSLSSNNRQLIFRGFSRVEVETPLICDINISTDLFSLLLSLKTLSTLVLNYNDSPQWYPDSWMLPWTANKKENRKLLSITTLHEFYQILYKFKSPENKLLLGYCLLIFTTIVEGQLRVGNEEYGLKFFSMFMSELSYLLALITSQHRYISSYDMHSPSLPHDNGEEKRVHEESKNQSDDQQSGMETQEKGRGKVNGKGKETVKSEDIRTRAGTGGVGIGSSGGKDNGKDKEDHHEQQNGFGNEINETVALYEPLVNVSLLPLNPSYEFLSRCAIQTIYTLILFDQSHDSLFLFYQYEIVFQETPLCEAVIYLMLQYPQNATIQSKGLFIIQKFLENQISVTMVSACFEKLLCQLMEIHGEDGSIHSSFCHILILLINFSDTNRDIIISSPLLKWIIVILKYYSPENGPLACQLIVLLASNDTICTKFANIETCQGILKLLEKHAMVLRVQIEGIKTLCYLSQKSMKCFKQIRQVRGEKILEKSRTYLKEIISAHEEGLDHQLEHSGYNREDVMETLQLSNPKKFIGLCSLS